MDARVLFDVLLEAETEQAVLEVLESAGYLSDPAAWRNLGDMENNFSIVGNQHSEATGALVEKVINSIDAVLMAGCYRAGVDPEGPDAPPTMTEAVRRFFNVRDGRLGQVEDPRELTRLAENIHFVATGSPNSPSYLIVDRGEGQTPAMFPDTFMSLAQSNKLRTPFVQGRYNAGGTGVLPFCGTENFQLIASKRDPEAPVRLGDTTAGLWGFTLVRRIEPTAADRRKNPVYVYLAPGGNVPTFAAESIPVLPSDAKGKQVPQAYVTAISSGSVVKLYNFQWSARSLATRDARHEFEKYLHAPCLPFRVTETRVGYTANYYKTTVTGIWATIEAAGTNPDNPRVETGFPIQETMSLPNIGTLTYRVAVFGAEVNTKNIPKGVYFDLAGQAQGGLPPDFISRRVGFEFLRSHMLVSVDCTEMVPRARLDLFMAARDRLRRNPTLEAVASELERNLKNHPGLRALNGARLNRAIEKGLSSEEDVIKTLNQLLQQDPGLRRLFNLGDRLVTTVGPTEPPPFEGVRFPTFFRLGRHGATVTKVCPINRTVRVELVTDAANDYFQRAESPGWFALRPDGALAHESLWNGVWRVALQPPHGSKVGDVVEVRFAVSDLEREGTGKVPFEATVMLQIAKEDLAVNPPGPKPPRKGPGPKKHEQPELGLPSVVEIRKDRWEEYEPPFTTLEAMRVIKDPETGRYVYVLNLDNTYLLTDLRSLGLNDKALATYWFKWGLLLCALGTQKHVARIKEQENGTAPDFLADLDPLDATNLVLGGVASVIVPAIRNLYRGPSSG